MDPEQALVVEGGHEKSNIQNLAWRVTSVQQQNCKPPRILLSNINGMLYAGECCALMGPSGSGKTTLLNTLANRPVRGQAIDGSIVVNGAALKPSDFRRVSCFVEHEVSLIGGLTVFETVSFAAKLASST
ncbi:hypothetical protein NW762_005359 [Fusarium torreyae]|uniref:ABC transporter domain-containing protein n=1 Tax=Fusarium torreyae TaxID=1237075 RepID=A0A9W8VFP4_9HYPO|nr:hypothetical protein NW762_005359 [Fusarium torreyae]